MISSKLGRISNSTRKNSEFARNFEFEIRIRLNPTVEFSLKMVKKIEFGQNQPTLPLK